MRSNPTRLGKYELQQALGRGTMGEVWKAFDTQAGRSVAVKILHPDLSNDPNFITRFEHERQILCSLNHPNIVRIHDFGVSSESNPPIAYIVMDYIEGYTLSNFIQNTSGKKQFPPSTDIVHLFTSIGNAIDYAHQKGIICCKIKPSNILIDAHRTAQNPMDTAMLTDLGMANIFRMNSGTPTGSWVERPSIVRQSRRKATLAMSIAISIRLGLFFMKFARECHHFGVIVRPLS